MTIRRRTHHTEALTRKQKQDSADQWSVVRCDGWQQVAAETELRSRGAAEPRSRSQVWAQQRPVITAERTSAGPDWSCCKCLIPGIAARPSRIEARQRCTDTRQSCREETQTPAPALKRQEGKRAGNELRSLGDCVSKEVCGIAAARERTSQGQEAGGEAEVGSEALRVSLGEIADSVNPHPPS
ncbi:hypothetical protein NDU88_001566 [Pleurodeles waltl]|uniref:Uncharacterized protein n=1 Tax=Pleurodeles waltl TaxID=8319 RepID=A0AAV7VZV6_PLEWA|nr:hypothetical protein NDU88_001566 [Pleurodeles waltl]